MTAPSSTGAANGDCQKRTCTFVSSALHTLQRVPTDRTERARGFRRKPRGPYLVGQVVEDGAQFADARSPVTARSPSGATAITLAVTALEWREAGFETGRDAWESARCLSPTGARSPYA
jgi:hypothetical protein